MSRTGTTRLSRRLREERGIGLVEVLVGTIVGLIVTASAFSVYDGTTGSVRHTTGRTEASSSGRVAMGQISQQLRSMSCTALGANPVVQVGADSITFYGDLDGDTVVDPVRRTLSTEATGGGRFRIVLTVDYGNTEPSAAENPAEGPGSDYMWLPGGAGDDGGAGQGGGNYQTAFPVSSVPRLEAAVWRAPRGGSGAGGRVTSGPVASPPSSAIAHGPTARPATPRFRTVAGIGVERRVLLESAVLSDGSTSLFTYAGAKAGEDDESPLQPSELSTYLQRKALSRIDVAFTALNDRGQDNVSKAEMKGSVQAPVSPGDAQGAPRSFGCR